MKKLNFTLLVIHGTAFICLLSCSKKPAAAPATAESNNSVVGYWYEPASGDEFMKGLWFRADGTVRVYDDNLKGPSLADTANSIYSFGTYVVKGDILSYDVNNPGFNNFPHTFFELFAFMFIVNCGI